MIRIPNVGRISEIKNPENKNEKKKAEPKGPAGFFYWIADFF